MIPPIMGRQVLTAQYYKLTEQDNPQSATEEGKTKIQPHSTSLQLTSLHDSPEARIHRERAKHKNKVKSGPTTINNHHLE